MHTEWVGVTVLVVVFDAFTKQRVSEALELYRNFQDILVYGTIANRGTILTAQDKTVSRIHQTQSETQFLRKGGLERQGVRIRRGLLS